MSGARTATADGRTVADAGRRTRRGAAALSGTNLVVAGANYAFSLVLVRLLAADDYVAYASVQSLLLVLGSGAMAAVPWAVARHVAADPRDDSARHALGFGLAAAGAQGVVFALVTWVVVLSTSGARLALPAAAAALALSVVVAPLGVLQGRGRLTEISVLRLGETVVRIGLSLAVVAAFGADPTGPVVGFAVASTLLFVVATALVRDAFPLRVRGLRPLAGHTLRLGGVQLCLASLGAADTVVVAATHLPAASAAGYQVAALLGRVPLFVASAVAMAYYTAIAADAPGAVAADVRRALRLLLLLTVPVAVLVASAPPVLVAIAAGGTAPSARPLLAPTAVAGLGVAVVTVLVTALQARGDHDGALRVALPAAVAQPLVLLLAARSGSVGWFAWANAGVVVVVVAVLAHRTRRWAPWRAVAGHGRGLAAVAACGAGALAWPPGWWPTAAVAAFTVVRALRDRSTTPPSS